MDEITASGGEAATAAGKAQPVQGWQSALALTGFMLVAVTQVSNMILARGLAGSASTPDMISASRISVR